MVTRYPARLFVQQMANLEAKEGYERMWIEMATLEDAENAAAERAGRERIIAEMDAERRLRDLADWAEGMVRP